MFDENKPARRMRRYQSRKGRLKVRAAQISSVVDSLVLILLAKTSFNLVFRNQVGVDRESVEGWCFVSGHDF